MASNNLTSNTVEDLARIFTEKFDNSMVLTKAVDTQLLQGRFTPRAGAEVSFKRPTDFNEIETPDGDISASNKSVIIAGKSTANLQNYITVATEWENVEEANELDQLDQLIAPMARRAVTKLELNLGQYMQRNGGLAVGTPGTAVTTWSDVSRAQAEMQSLGVPMDADWNYVMNPFTKNTLADVQNSLSSGSNVLVDDAWKRAQITEKFAGMNVMTSNALKSFTSGASADRIGAIVGTPDPTYVVAKDTMTQSIDVDGFTTAGTINAGDVIEVTGVFQLNQATREVIVDDAGTALPWRAVVTADVQLSAGAGTLIVTGPAIFEADGQYNTVNAPLVNDAIVTILGPTAQLRQPNLIFHPQAFGVGTVKLPKLFATDTVATMESGFSIRVSKYADGDANVQKVRFDLLPAFITFNPFFGGQAWG